MKKEYIKEQADIIVNDMKKRNRLDWSVATCDYSNWDRTLHRMFPEIANELRRRGLTVRKVVNHGVTYWIITL